MSIKKRLIFSNIAMVILPIIGFLLIEMVLGFLLFAVWEGSLTASNLQTFTLFRFIGLLIVLIVTNGMLTYFVSRSILNPVRQLTGAAEEIRSGNLDFSIQAAGKDELGELSATFESMRIRLKEAEALQKQYENNRKELIASISHDLKTPITSIQGYVAGMRDGIANTPEKRNHYMETIYKKTNEMEHLIDELFLYSRLDLEQLPFQMERVDLAAYFSDFIEELRYTVEENGGSVALYARPDHPYIVMADREKLNRAVTNIIQNSLKYMDKPDRTLSIELSEKEDMVVIRITDNGSGIPADALPDIFDSFYRVDGSRNSATGGSGLGLAIVKRIIEGQGGSVWAESEPGKGTSMFFTLKKG